VSETDPQIDRNDILVLNDPSFSTDHVCLVAGAASPFGRATAVAAAANQLMTVGLDADETGGRWTQRLAREMGGQMIFIKTDLSDAGQLTHAVGEAAKLGRIQFLANTVADDPDAAFFGGMGPDDLEPLDLRWLQAPLLLSQKVFAHMRANGDGVGVIGNVAATPSPFGCLGLQGLSRTINQAGAGRIRSFAIDTVGSGRSAASSRIGAIEVANAVVFGFSRFAGYFIKGDFRLACA
jgi:3-hydroxybutyrate dehydrogenase